MKNNKTRYFFLWLFLLLFTTYQAIAAQKVNTFAEFKGYWAYGCGDDVDYPGYIEVTDKNKIVINVADNQIYLITRAEVSKNNTQVFNLYYKSSDVGRGGMDIPWKKVSNSVIIGTLQLVKEKKLLFKWCGLKDANNQKIKLPFYSFPFNKHNTNAMLVKCEN